MQTEIQKASSGHISPFEQIRRTNEAGVEYWSSRDFAQVLQYNEYRNFEQVIQKARAACFNSGQRLDEHFVEVTEMIEIGKGGKRPVKTIFLSRYACYLIIQNADPEKDIVALGQTYFAVQTRRQELSDRMIEDERRLLLRDEMTKHNLKSQLDASPGRRQSAPNHQRAWRYDAGRVAGGGEHQKVETEKNACVEIGRKHP